MEAHWKAFSANILGPALRRTQPLPLSTLAPLAGAPDETVIDSAQVEQELREYFGA